MSLEVEHVSLKQRVTLIWTQLVLDADVFDKFFNRFNKKSSDFYNLKQLDPGFQIIFDKENALSIPANWSSILSLFEEKEKGSAKKLENFIVAAFKYDFGINKLVYEPGLSIKKFAKKIFFQIHANFTSYRKHVAKYFKTLILRHC